MADFFHLFFPSWRFFENTGAFIHIEYRHGSDKRLAQAEWLKLFPPQRRSWLKIFWNPMGNEILTLQNHASRLAQDPDDESSLQIIENYVQTLVPANSFFQFKLIGVSFDSTNHEQQEDLILSSILSKAPR